MPSAVEIHPERSSDPPPALRLLANAQQVSDPTRRVSSLRSEAGISKRVRGLLI
jgi:hypothetical protein